MNIGRAVKVVLPEAVLQRAIHRQMRVFCIGTPKSGTTSIARIFAEGYRWDHEPDVRTNCRVLNRHYKDRISDEEYLRFLRRRDRQFWLDVESNCFLGYRPDLLLEAFPEARFILPIRDPRSWLHSMLNAHVQFPPEPGTGFRDFHEVFFPDDGVPHRPDEAPLAERGLYPIRRYLDYWLRHNRTILETIPAKQLLLLRTESISESLDSIASFLGVPEDTLGVKTTHANRTKGAESLLDLLDARTVEAETDRVRTELLADERVAALF